MPINFFSCSELLNQMCPQTTNQGYRKDQMAILGGLKTKYEELTYQDQKQGCATCLVQNGDLTNVSLNVWVDSMKAVSQEK